MQYCLQVGYVFLFGQVVVDWIGGGLQVDLFVGKFFYVFLVVQGVDYWDVLGFQVLVDCVVFVGVEFVVSGVFEIFYGDFVVGWCQ